jgi:hypothetical protein
LDVLKTDRGKYPSLAGRKMFQWVEKSAGKEGNHHPDGWKRISAALTEGGKEDLSCKWPARWPCATKGWRTWPLPRGVGQRRVGKSI